jgi:signal peptidase I
MNFLKKIGAWRSLNKSKKKFKRYYRLYRRKEKGLADKESVQQLLLALQSAILAKDAAAASTAALHLEEGAARLMPRSWFDKALDSTISLGVALLVAIAVRQMWFEFYSIPTGSMRPTLKEGDYLVVSKSDYGINTPLRSGHFYFDPDLVERGSVVIFNGENMDMPDDDTMYFYIIPGKKQYIKRLIGKPGDTLYFYGGEIYGVNARGQELNELRDPKYFKEIEHIPFIRFDGKVETPNPATRGIYRDALVYQMGEPLAKLTVNQMGIVGGEILKKSIKQYGDFWGFKNYGMSRILNEAQVKELHPKIELETGLLYLEIHHHPSLQGAKIIRDEMGRFRPSLGNSVSLLPLKMEHLAQVLAHMTTSRFEVKEGTVYRFGSGYEGAEFRPQLPGVPDGTYEFQNGIAHKILPTGIALELSSDHPLLAHNPAQIQSLYNFGFEWSNYYTPGDGAPLPSRYAYFRSGDLYLMGGPIMKKGDPLLTLFRKREYEAQSLSTSIKPYIPFDDAGPPLKDDGSLDVEFIKKFGVTVPDKMYLVMGDNHAMSADSRMFGFVPEPNLRGGASFIFWPAGPRWGRIPQSLSAHLTFPNLTVWSLAFLFSTTTYLFIRRKYYTTFTFNRVMVTQK